MKQSSSKEDWLEFMSINPFLHFSLQSTNVSHCAFLLILALLHTTCGCSSRTAPTISPISIEEMLRNPKATLYSAEDFSGSTEDYSIEKAGIEGGCSNFQNLSGSVQSVETFGSCVRLFTNVNCTGWSIAVYPGSKTAHNVLSHLPKDTTGSHVLRSIGPCIQNEFQSSTFKYSANSTVLKNSSNKRNFTPDLLEFCVEAYPCRRIRNKISEGSFFSDYGFYNYILGSAKVGVRPEYIRTSIGVSMLKLPILNKKDAEYIYYEQLEKREGDVLGYGVPQNIGGGAEQGLVFAQTPEGKKEWDALTSDIRPFLESRSLMEHGKSARAVFALNFLYGNSTTSRPDSFLYWISYQYNGKIEKIVYGHTLN